MLVVHTLNPLIIYASVLILNYADLTTIFFAF